MELTNHCASRSRSRLTTIRFGLPMAATSHSAAFKRAKPAFTSSPPSVELNVKYATLIGRNASSTKSFGTSVAFLGRPTESYSRFRIAHPSANHRNWLEDRTQVDPRVRKGTSQERLPNLLHAGRGGNHHILHDIPRQERSSATLSYYLCATAAPSPSVSGCGPTVQKFRRPVAPMTLRLALLPTA